MRKLAQLRKAAESARLQAKRMAATDGEPEHVLQLEVDLLVTLLLQALLLATATTRCLTKMSFL